MAVPSVRRMEPGKVLKVNLGDMLARMEGSLKSHQDNLFSLIKEELGQKVEAVVTASLQELKESLLSSRITQLGMAEARVGLVTEDRHKAVLSGLASLEKKLDSVSSSAQLAAVRNAAGVATIISITDFKKKLGSVLKGLQCRECHGVIHCKEEVSEKKSKKSLVKSMPVLETSSPQEECEADLRAIMEEENIALEEEEGREGHEEDAIGARYNEELATVWGSGSFLETSRVEDSFLQTSRVEDSFLETSRVEDSFLGTSRVEDSSMQTSRVEDSFLQTSRVEDSFLREISKVEDSFLQTSRVESSKGPKDPSHSQSPALLPASSCYNSPNSPGDSTRKRRLVLATSVDSCMTQSPRTPSSLPQGNLVSLISRQRKDSTSSWGSAASPTTCSSYIPSYPTSYFPPASQHTTFPHQNNTYPHQHNTFSHQHAPFSNPNIRPIGPQLKPRFSTSQAFQPYQTYQGHTDHSNNRNFASSQGQLTMIRPPRPSDMMSRQSSGLLDCPVYTASIPGPGETAVRSSTSHIIHRCSLCGEDLFSLTALEKHTVVAHSAATF